MAARAGEKGPVLPLGNLGWTGRNWEKILVYDGASAVSVQSWGSPPVTLTGRDITLDFQALTDDSIQGLMRTLGDAGATPNNATGDTVLQLLANILSALGGTANEHYERLDFTAPLGGTFSAPQSFSQAVEYIDCLVENGELDVEVSDSAGTLPGSPDYHMVPEDAIKVIPLNTLTIQVRNRGGATFTTAATAIVIGYRN